MQHSLHVLTVGIFCVLGTSCYHSGRKEGKTMTLGEALTAVSDGLAEASTASEKTPGRKKYGLVPDEATVTLVISESSSKENGLTVNLAPPNVPATFGGSTKVGYSDKLENTIQVKLKSAYFAPANTPYSKWDVEQIRQYLVHGKVPADASGKERRDVPPPERIGLFRKIIELEIAGQISRKEADTMLLDASKQ